MFSLTIHLNSMSSEILFKRNNWTWLFIFSKCFNSKLINIVTLSLSWCRAHLSIKQYDISLLRIFIRYRVASDLYKTIKGTQEFWGFPKHTIHIAGNQRNTFEKWEEAPRNVIVHTWINISTVYWTDTKSEMWLSGAMVLWTKNFAVYLLRFASFKY